MDITNYFDKVFVLHCTDYPERRKLIQNLNNIGITQYEIVYTCTTPINSLLSKTFENNEELFTVFYKNTKGANNYEFFGKVFDCAYNFYKIIKSSYNMGLNHILLFEDDIVFRINGDELQSYFDEMPNDYDCIKFSYIVAKWYSKFNEQEINSYISNINSKFFRVPPEIRLNTNTMFALSRKGMKYYIDFMEHMFCCADVPFRDIQEDIRLYATTKQLLYVNPIKSTLTLCT